jgi:hypothetical protein
LTPKFGCFNSEEFEERSFERRMASNPGLAIAECRYWVRKLQARYLAGDYAEAMEASSEALRLLWTSTAFLEEAEYHFYSALSRAASCDAVTADGCQQHLEALAGHHRRLEFWAENCPDNFENRAALVGAEIARLESRDLDAMRLYEKASTRLTQTASSTTRRSRMSVLRPFTAHVGSTSSLILTSATPGPATHHGARMVK